MNNYKAGFVGAGTVLHLTQDKTAVCFDSRRGNQRRIYFAQAVATTAKEALEIAVTKTNANVCQVCAKVAA